MEDGFPVTSADWSILIPAVAALLTSVAAWLRAQAAHKSIAALKDQQGPKL